MFIKISGLALEDGNCYIRKYDSFIIIIILKLFINIIQKMNEKINNRRKKCPPPRNILYNIMKLLVLLYNVLDNLHFKLKYSTIDLADFFKLRMG